MRRSTSPQSTSLRHRRQNRRRLPAALAVAVALATAACPSKKGGPSATLEKYSAVLGRHDYGGAYEMMSEKFRSKHSKDEFVRMMKENKREVQETAARLKDARHSLEVTAELQYGLGDKLRLVRESGTWRVASNPIRFYSMATPRDAVRSFVRAYRLKRWDVMMRFVPSKYRERMTVEKLREQFEGIHREENATMMNMLEANLELPITVEGNEARMPYGDKYEVKFVREEGLWRIQDLD
jgi:hypothetical protein